MANTLLTPSIIAKEALMQLENNLVMGNLVHRDYKKEFIKIGDTVTIPKPVKFLVNSGADITSQIQDVSEQSTSIKVDIRRNVAWKFSSQELTLSIREYSERYIKPAMIVLANEVDSSLTGLYVDAFVNSGTPGTTPASFAALGGGAQKMSEFAVPADNRKLVLNPAGHWSMADGLKGIFNQQRVEGLIGRGFLGQVANFDIYEDQNVKQHTKGTGSGYLSNGATQTGATIAVDTGTGTLKKGDIITFAGVNAVNPVSKADLGYLMPFVLAADYAGGAGNISISPSIVASGAYQNVTNAIADNSAVTLTNSHAANIAFHKNAFALVVVPLEMPESVPWKAQMKYNNLGIRVLKSFDILKDEEIVRLDIFYGVKTIYPELACRLLG